ncbi:MAG: RIP metalloprotease RseP [bacterium]
MTTIVSFILVLGFLVFVHELGHFLAARHVGVRVERFAIFMPLPFSSKFFPASIYKKTIGETEYVLNWLPLGGYVKLFGQNLDDEDPTDPANYAAKTKLQRAYILVAGPLMNMVWAVVFITAFYMVGAERPDYTTQISYVAEKSLAAEAKFMVGDTVVRIGDTEITDYSEVNNALIGELSANDVLRIWVRRGGAELLLRLDGEDLAAGEPLGMRYGIHPVIARFGETSPARAAGIEPGDRVVAVNGKPVSYWSQMSPLIQQGKGKAISITVERGGGRLDFRMQPRLDESSGRWLIQVMPANRVERFGLADAFNHGMNDLITITQGTFMFLGRLIFGQGSLDAMAGPVRIGQIIGQTAQYSYVQLVRLMAIISLSLGLLNLFPIPALDGGHLLLLGVEAIKRGPLSQRLRERTQLVGISLLLALFITITINDVALLF